VSIATTITLNMTINDAILAYPQILPVLQQAGLDACCGGGLSIAEAARRHGLDAGALFRALEDAVSAPAGRMP